MFHFNIIPLMKKQILLLACLLLGGLFTLTLVSCGDDDDNNGSIKLEAQEFSVEQVFFTMVPVEGGKFKMGAPDTDTEAQSNERPQHEVTVSSFYIAETEVTQALWKAVMGADNNPGYPKGALLPVNCVSWDACQQFIAKLNTLTGKKFRLPTEAEWEYAARGGNKSEGYKFAGSNNVAEVAWYGGNSESKIWEVAKKAPNELDLYDMTGNVWEWCQDWYAADYYSSSPSTNPKGPATGEQRVLRGGDVIQPSKSSRVSQRSCKEPDTESSMYCGFRLAMNP